MTDERTLRASDLLGRTATGPDGEPLGRVVDLVEWLARRVPRHSRTTVPWGELRLAAPA